MQTKLLPLLLGFFLVVGAPLLAQCKASSCCKAKKKTIRVGAVAYGPGAVTIFENIKSYFSKNKQPLDYVLFSNYDAQVQALFDGNIDIAWNTPLAHAQSQLRSNNTCQNLIMRDVDFGYQSVILVRKDAQINSIKEIEGKTLALGTKGSAESSVLPCYYLQQNQVDLSKIQILASTSDIGKHGCSGKAEADVLDALINGKAQAGAIGIGVWNSAKANTSLNTEGLQVLWESPKFSHCTFTALSTFDKTLADRFVEIMLSMKMEDPCANIVLTMEGAQQWKKGEESGFEDLKKAIELSNL